MTKKIILLIVGSLIVFFIANLWPNLNLFLPLAILLLTYSDWRYAVVWALTGGLLLDLFSTYNFGIQTISYLFTTLILYRLTTHRLTARSLYSLQIILITGTIIRHLILWLLTTLLWQLNLTVNYLSLNRLWLNSLFWQLLLGLLVMYLAQNLINKWQKYFR